MVDFAEKIDKFRENEVPADLILNYYVDFIWYFGSQLYPVFLFLAVIFFTSRLANNTEITAILSSGLSFQRFAKPYFISASIIVSFALFSGMFIVPKSNQNFNEFISEYMSVKSKINNNKHNQKRFFSINLLTKFMLIKYGLWSHIHTDKIFGYNKIITWHESLSEDVIFNSSDISFDRLGYIVKEEDIIKSLDIYGGRHRYIPALAGQRKFKITEIIVNHRSRKYGITKYGGSRIFPVSYTHLTLPTNREV